MVNSNELFDALGALETEKGITAEDVLEGIKTAIKVAVKKYYNVAEENIDVDIDMAEQKYKVTFSKEIVEEVEDPTTQITLDEALEKNKRYKIGGKYVLKLDTKQIGRIAALSGKNLIHQAINEAVKAKVLSQYQSKLNEIVNAKVLKVEPATGNANILIDKNETMLFASEQIPGEQLVEGENIKVYVSNIISNERRCIVKVSRTHRDLVKRLFEIEVPEIFDGTVEVKAISREAGSRTKIAVYSKNDKVDPVGACIGQNRTRIQNILSELNNEKIDIVKYSENAEEFIAQALSPAEVLSVTVLDAEAKTCEVIVPDSQLSLAIGNKGQNAKLAARLTGFKIDIRPESGIIKAKDE